MNESVIGWPWRKINEHKETLGLGGLTFGYEFCFKLEWFESPRNSSDFSLFFFF